MKICVISFDFWNYDQHIVEALISKGIDAHHINIGSYKHKNIGARLQNTFSKVVLKKNIKNKLRQELILEKLEKIGMQDQILIINPELIERKYHEKIKTYTKKYIAYLYDSLARCPAEHLLDLFDEVFSFDKNDAKKHNFQLITNYNYLPQLPLNKTPKYDVVYLASIDKRMQIADEIGKKLLAIGKKINFVVVGKKFWMKKYFSKNHKNWTYTMRRINHNEIPKFYNEGKVILDLVRDNQVGLSFRFFEAMALKKKIITNNATVVEYDFYNPQNILLVNDDLSNLGNSFLESDYQELSIVIYEKYTLNNWVEKVFNL